jgi:phage gpG-like protein
MGLKYDHAAGRRIVHNIRAMANRAEDLTPAWPKVGRYFSRQIRRQWSTRGKHFGTPWKPLARRTRLEKTRLGFGRIPLVRTGKLRESFIGRPMDIETETYKPQSATFGSGLSKAVWQQKGTHRNGKQHIPPRPILKIGPEQSAEVADILRRHIMGRKRRTDG